MDGPSALEILWIKENTIHVFWLLLLFWETFFKKPFWLRKKFISLQILGGRIQHFLKHIDAFLNIYCDEITYLMRITVAVYYFLPVFVILVILFYQLHFFQVPQKVLQNWSKNIVCIFRYSGFSANYLDSNLHFNLGFQDHTNRLLYLVVTIAAQCLL